MFQWSHCPHWWSTADFTQNMATPLSVYMSLLLFQLLSLYFGSVLLVFLHTSMSTSEEIDVVNLEVPSQNLSIGTRNETSPVLDTVQNVEFVSTDVRPKNTRTIKIKMVWRRVCGTPSLWYDAESVILIEVWASADTLHKFKDKQTTNKQVWDYVSKIRDEGNGWKEEREAGQFLWSVVDCEWSGMNIVSKSIINDLEHGLHRFFQTCNQKIGTQAKDTHCPCLWCFNHDYSYTKSQMSIYLSIVRLFVLGARIWCIDLFILVILVYLSCKWSIDAPTLNNRNIVRSFKTYFWGGGATIWNLWSVIKRSPALQCGALPSSQSDMVYERCKDDNAQSLRKFTGKQCQDKITRDQRKAIWLVRLVLKLVTIVAVTVSHMSCILDITILWQLVLVYFAYFFRLGLAVTGTTVPVYFPR